MLHFDSVPKEIVGEFCWTLDIRSFLNFSQTSKTIHNTIMVPEFFKFFAERDFFQKEPDIMNGTNDHKKVYKVCHTVQKLLNDHPEEPQHALIHSIDEDCLPSFLLLSKIRQVDIYKKFRQADETKVNCLHYALLNDKQKIACYLLNHHFEPLNKKTAYGERPLHCAFLSGNPRFTDFFFKKENFNFKEKTSSDETIYHLACYSTQDPGILKRIELLGINPNDVTTKGDPALFYAAAGANIPIVRTFIKEREAKGENITSYLNYRSKVGMTAFLIACTCGHVKMLTYLYLKGADPHAITANGRAAVHFAINASDTKILDRLKLLGCDLHASTKNRETALHYACKRSAFLIITYLINEGLKLEAVTLDQETPLFYASRKGCLNTLKILIEKGANMYHANLDGQTALHIACKYQVNLEYIAALLEQCPALLNRQDRHGNSALHYASKKGTEEMVNLLCGFGADIWLQNTEDYNPQQVAMHYQNQPVINFYGRKSDLEQWQIDTLRDMEQIDWEIKKQARQRGYAPRGQTS